MRLKSLKLTQFKGIKSFTLNVDGHSAEVYGANRKGKTTLMDGYQWLLVDKDSQEATKFGIKGVDINGNAIEKLDHEVEGVFDIDGKTVTLKKVHVEKWTKQRGKATRTLTGHTNNYFIDGVPGVTMAKYKAKIKEITGISKDRVFRMLTNTRYINKTMKWEDRRDLIFEVCGDAKFNITDVVKAHPDLLRVTTLLKDHTLEEMKLVIKAARKDINDELEKIPVRIDEKTREVPTEETRSVDELGKEKSHVNERLRVMRHQLSMLESGGALGLKKKELLDVENSIREIENTLTKKADEAMAKKRSIARYCEDSLVQTQGKVRIEKENLKDIDSKIRGSENDTQKLRDLWGKEDAEEFQAPETKDACPACGALPEHQVNFSEEKALAEFNEHKATLLADITTEGKEQCVRLKKTQAARIPAQKKLTEAEAALAECEKDYEKAKKDMEITPVTPAPKKDHQALLDGKATIETEISMLSTGSETDTKELYASIARLETVVEDVNAALTIINTAKTTRERITELNAEEKRLSAEYEKLEGDLDLLDDFTRAQCGMISGKIDQRFQITKWKLYEDQINGRTKDCFIATMDGRQYHDLSGSEKDDVGIDTINVLSEHFNVEMPMFIDNAESNTNILHSKSQQIALVVSKEDETLRVKIEDRDQRAA